MLIQVGTREILLDDARNVAKKAKDCGVEVIETEYYGMWHVFQMLGEGKLPE